jgi:hypothetical protein
VPLQISAVDLSSTHKALIRLLLELMTTWANINVQDSISSIIEQFIYFHDQEMDFILTFI